MGPTVYLPSLLKSIGTLSQLPIFSSTRLIAPMYIIFSGKETGAVLLRNQNGTDKTVFIDGSEWSYTGHMVSGQVRKDKLDCSKGMPWIWQEMRDRVIKARAEA